MPACGEQRRRGVLDLLRRGAATRTSAPGSRRAGNRHLEDDDARRFDELNLNRRADDRAHAAASVTLRFNTAGPSIRKFRSPVAGTQRRSQ